MEILEKVSMLRWMLVLVCLVMGVVAQAEVPKPIRVLIIDGFSNHDWAHTTALIRGVLEPTKLFVVTVATCPGKADDPAFGRFRPEFGKCDVVLVNCNSLGNGGQDRADSRW